MSLNPPYRDPHYTSHSRHQPSSSSSSPDPRQIVQAPSTYSSYESRDSGIGSMSPPYQGWTPGLEPIHGSPSYPAGTEVTPSELEEEESEEEDVVDQSYRTEHDRYSRERGQSYEHEEIIVPAVVQQVDLEQGIDSSTQDEYEVRGNGFGRRARNFVGGFVSRLQRLPNAMVKNSPRAEFYVPPSPPEGGLAEPAVMITNGSNLGDPDSPASMVSYPASTALPPNPSSNGATASTDSSSSQSSPSIASPRLPRRYRRFDDSRPNQQDSVLSSPMPISIAEVSSYEEAHTPFPFTNPADRSWGSYVDRIHRLIVDVLALPWVSPQVVEEYIPELDSSRGRQRQSDYPTSWYAPKRTKNTSFDHEPEPEIKVISAPPPILGVDSPSPEYVFETIPPTPSPTRSGRGSYSYYSQRTRSPAMHSERRLTLTPSFTERSLGPSEGGRTAIRPAMSPGTVTTSIGGWPSPGASSHGMGRHSITSSYHYASPRHHFRNFGGASVMSTPQTRLESDGFLSPQLR